MQPVTQLYGAQIAQANGGKGPDFDVGVWQAYSRFLRYHLPFAETGQTSLNGGVRLLPNKKTQLVESTALISR